MQGPTPEDLRRMEALIRTVQAGAGTRCAATGVPLGPHELLVNVALGRKDRPLALEALATAEGQALGTFRERMLEYVAVRPCYRGAWQWASEQTGHQDAMRPPLAWDDAPAPPQDAPAAPAQQGEHAQWDAGDMGCGDLVLELRTRLREMAPGQVLRLRATDLGAPEDIPAWCGMTGNRLIRQQDHSYWIQRKE